MHDPDRPTVAVIGLGYVGLTLAAAMGRTFPTIGFDIDESRVQELRNGMDRNAQVPPDRLKVEGLTFVADPSALNSATYFIVDVPTPVDSANVPDLAGLRAASGTVGQVLRDRQAQGASVPPAYVIFESTVYPGCTEEVCVPVIEAKSGLTCGEGFFVGYSPERINPGDEDHTIDRVVKVVSGQTPEVAERIADLYRPVTSAGVFIAKDIRTAEAAKVIENVQRDLNIALTNELALLFHQLGLDTRDVLSAAATKWNFLNFTPGSVGGHCIPVDPYYLTYKAEQVGYHPELILAGRRLNDSIAPYYARQAIRLLAQTGKAIASAKVLLLGVAYKENVRDVRNTPATAIVNELKTFGVSVEVYDPVTDPADIVRLGLTPTAADPFEATAAYDCIILSVPHRQFATIPTEHYSRMLNRQPNPGVLLDVKGILESDKLGSDVLYWRM